MPLNEKKIIQIILERCGEVPERSNGYRAAVIDAITDIIQAERQHRAQGTNIQQKVNDKVAAAGRFLASQRGQIAVEEE
jgi:hypothetical protein